MKFEYNFLNLPQVADGGDTGIENIYDATGRKWQTTSTVDVLDIYQQPTGETYTETKLYLNGIEFVGEGTVASRLSSINPSSNGRKAYEAGASGESRIEYYHTDHLGNVRLAFSDLDGDNAITVRDIYYPANEIVQERHYYPFGLTHTGPWFATVVPDNVYRYNGKELDEATGLYDYGARYYDPAIARWGQVDPLAEQYASHSPYNYVLGNPIRLIDPDGMRVSLFETMEAMGANHGAGPDEEAEPPSNGITFFSDDTGSYFWNNSKGSYDHYDPSTGKYTGQYTVNINADSEDISLPVGDFNMAFHDRDDSFNSDHTPLLAHMVASYLAGKGSLNSITDQERYPGVLIFESTEMQGGITLGNVIFVESAYYRSSVTPYGGNSLLEHEYGHYLDFKLNFNFNATGYFWNVGLPSFGSAAGWGTYKKRHSDNPVEVKADALGKGYFGG